MKAGLKRLLWDFFTSAPNLENTRDGQIVQVWRTIAEKEHQCCQTPALKKEHALDHMSFEGVSWGHHVTF